MDLADLILWKAAIGEAPALVLSPLGEEHALAFDEGSIVREAVRLRAALGDAVAARLAILADLDVASAEEQLRKVRVRAGGDDIDLLVSVRASEHGLGAEVRRLVPPAEAKVSPGDAPVSRLGVYRIDGELGRGGMGLVYRGVHEALGRPVAIKVLYAEHARNAEVAARFVREARAASRARHPGIVEVFDFGTLPDSRAFLVMEVVEGPTLQEIINQGALPPRRALELARQIAGALGAAHAAGVVHRDLKPANVFVIAGEKVKIGDFGAAKLLEGASPADTGQQGSVIGTPFYMSPEHARGLPTDRRTDVYALGCVLFEMLTGGVPYPGETPVAVLTSHIVAPLPDVRSPHGPLPEAVLHVVHRALAKRVEERFQTMEEMISDLDRALATLERSGWRRWLPV